MKKKDIILAALSIFVAFALFLFLRPSSGESGGEIQITADGEFYGRYSLFEEQEIVIEQEFGRNILYIRDGAAWMEKADCPDGYCIRQGKISKGKQTIVCLPHKLIVEVIGENGMREEEPAPPDATVQ